MAAVSEIDYLIFAQHPSGGWGYKAGHRPMVEATSLVLLALRDEPLASDAYRRGIAWLTGCQHEDGGWGINEYDLESGWQTAWALIALKKSGQAAERSSKANEWLLSVPTHSVSKLEFQSVEYPRRDNLEALVWPWLPGQAGWLEPTALAVIALKNTTTTAVMTGRINTAVEYFEQYRTPEGGWNIGNSSPLDTIILPRAYHTALVLTALAEIAPEHIQSRDIDALLQDLQRDPGMLAHAAGLLALKIQSASSEPIASFLSANQLPDGSWEHNPFVTAWSMLGLRGYL